MTKIALKVWQKVLIFFSFIFSVAFVWKDPGFESIVIDGKKYRISPNLPVDIPGSVNIMKKNGELLNRRSKHSKTYYLGNGKYKIVSQIMPVHFQDQNGNFQDINPVLVNEQLQGTIYEASLLNGQIGYTAKRSDDKSQFTFQLKEIGNVKPDYRKPEIDGNKATWKEIIPGMDLIIAFERYTVRVWRKIYNQDVAHNIVWDVEEVQGEKKIRLLEDIKGYDSEGRSLFSKREIRNESVEGNAKYYEMEDTFSGKSIQMAMKTRKRFLSKKITFPIEIESNIEPESYPIMIDADISVTPTAGGQDGFGGRVNANCNIFNTSLSLMNVWHDVGWGFLFIRGSWVRFAGITIPLSSTIDSATLTLRQDATSNGTDTVTVRVVDAQDPNAPATCWQALYPGTFAAATYQGTHTGNAADKAYDVQALVQELVNTFKYNNDHMVFSIKKQLTTYGVRGHFATKDAGANEPLLQINFTAPDPLTGAIIIVN